MDEKKSDKILKIDETPSVYDESVPAAESSLPDSRSRKAILLSSLEKSKKKIWFRTRAMIPEYEERERFLATTVTGIILQIIYIICGALYVLDMYNSQMYYLNTALTYELTRRPFKDNSGETLYFEKVDHIHQMFTYIKKRFIPSMYRTQRYPQQNITHPEDDQMFCNYLIGAVRLRQLRIKDRTCPLTKKIKEFRESCIADYKHELVDKSDFGPKTSNAWKYHSPEKTGVPEMSLVLGSYIGGGHLIDLPKDQEEALAVVEHLRRNLWVDRQTRVVFLEAILYNTNVNMFATINAGFEIPASGWMIPTMVIHPVRLVEKQSPRYLTVKIIFTALNVLYAFRCIREMFHFKRDYLKMFWNHVDTLIMGLSAYALYVDAYVRHYVIPKQLSKAKKTPDMYGHLDQARVLTRIRKEFVGFAVFLVYIRTFQYMNFNKTSNQLNRVIKKSSFNIMMFIIVFFIVFCAYSVSGTLIFGDVSDEFTHFGLTMFALVRMMFAKIDYNTITESRTFIGQIFILSYIMIIIFILMNIFLSILNCTYAEVRTELGSKRGDLQISDYIAIRTQKILQAMGFRIKSRQMRKQVQNAEEGKIRNILLECGFTNLEIEMFFARYNIDPTAEVGEVNIAELKDVVKQQQGSSKSSTVVMHRELEAIQLNKKDFKLKEQKIQEIKYIVQLLHERMNELIKSVEKATREMM